MFYRLSRRFVFRPRQALSFRRGVGRPGLHIDNGEGVLYNWEVEFRVGVNREK